MRRKAFARTLVLAVAACAASAAAGEAGQPPAASQHSEDVRHYDGPVLTLAGAIETALAHNPGLAALRQDTTALRQRPAQARALEPPMIDATIWQWPINTLNPASTNMYMFMVEQTLPGRGKRDLRAAVGEKDVAMADVDITIRARQIVNDIKQSYAALFVARKSVDVHLASVDLLRQLTDVAQAKYAAGRISQQDVLKPVLELSRLHTDIVMFDEQAGVAAARLNVLLDRVPETPIGPLEEPAEALLLPAPAALQAQALANQPELQRARIEVERGQAEVAAAARERKPDFVVQGGYQLMPNQTDALVARIGVTWPNAPWSRGKIDARLAELAANVDAATTRTRVMENAVRLAVQEAYVHARSAEERAALLRTTILPQARQMIDVARIAYQTDRVDFQAVIDDERTLLGSELEYIRSLSDFQQALADLERAVGADLPGGNDSDGRGGRRSRAMKRSTWPFVTIGIVAVALAGGAFAMWRLRDRPAPPPASPASAERPASSTSTPRGEVTIDPSRQQLIGVRIVPVTRASVEQAVRAAGVVRYDETRQADVNVKVEGWIRDLYVDSTGQPIQKGQPLFTLYSPDLLNTENEYLLALKTRDRLQQSPVPDARQRADDIVASARQRLVLWDLPAADIATLEQQRQAVDAVLFRSPATGFVIEKQAIAGLHVTPGQSLYKVADLSSVWVEADIYETELSGIRAGMPAIVTVDAYAGERFTGRVVYMYPYLDEKTRTNKVRLELPNGNGRLKPGMYANVELKLGAGTGLTVPSNAVLDSGKEQLVFVAKGDGVFQPRAVKVGRRLGDSTQILEGLQEGEQVATGASFFLDSESQLRASLQSYEPASSAASSTPAAAIDIAFRTVPDPARSGDNQMEATVKDAGGKPIDAADVTVQFFMAAMPTMNMPAMKNDVKLQPAGGGVYRGTGQIMMAGRWDATVTVSKGGQALGTKQLPVVAK